MIVDNQESKLGFEVLQRAKIDRAWSCAGGGLNGPLDHARRELFVRLIELEMYENLQRWACRQTVKRQPAIERARGEIARIKDQIDELREAFGLAPLRKEPWSS